MLRQIASVVVNQIGVSLLMLVSGVLSARILGPEQRGVLVTASLMAMLSSSLSHLGLPYAINYNLARSDDARDTIGKNIGVSLRMLPLSLFIAGAIYALAYTFGRGSLMKGLPASLILSSYLLCVISLFEQAVTHTFNGLRDFRWRNIFNLMPPLLIAIALLSLWLSRQHITPLVVLWTDITATTLTIMLGMSHIAKKYRPKVSLQVPDDWKQSYVGYSLKLYLSVIANRMNSRLDTLILKTLTGNKNVGLYSTGVIIAELLLFICSAVIAVLFPKIASLPEAERKRVSVLALGASLYIAIVGGVIFLAVIPWLVPMLYGQAFMPSVIVTMWLIPGMLALTIARILSHVMAGWGKPEYATYTTAAGLLVTVPLDLLLIPRFGIVGAAWASVIAYWVSALVCFSLYVHLTKSPVGGLIGEIFAAPITELKKFRRRRNSAARAAAE